MLCHWSTPTPNLQNFLTAAPLLITVGPCITPEFMLRSDDDSGYLLVIPQKPTVWLEGWGLMLSGISWTSRMVVALKLNPVTWLMYFIYSCVMPVCVYEHVLGGQRPTWVSFPRRLSCFYLTGASWLDQQVSRRDLYFPNMRITSKRPHAVYCCCFKVGGLIQILKLLWQTFYQLSYLPSLCIMARPSLAPPSPSTKTK